MGKIVKKKLSGVKTKTESKKMSKTALFMLNRPDGVILDMRAVLR